MTECCGLMGKIFGHCFERNLIRKTKSDVPFGPFFTYTGSSEGMNNLLDSCKDEEIYEIRCKRCGKHANDK